jgi:hypothetical protein
LSRAALFGAVAAPVAVAFSFRMVTQWRAIRNEATKPGVIDIA